MYTCATTSVLYMFFPVLLNIKLQSRSNADAKDVLHSSVKSVTMETAWVMLEGMLIAFQRGHHIFYLFLLNVVAILLESLCL